VLQYRFDSAGPLGDHAIGNLLIAGLWERLGDPVAGLDMVARLLGRQGRVLPMASVPLEIEADVIGSIPTARRASRCPRPGDGGQDAGEVISVRLKPPIRRPVRSRRGGARRRLDRARSGSWFTSVIPTCWCPSWPGHPPRGPRILHLNLEPPARPPVLRRQAHRVAGRARPDLRLDVVLADSGFASDDPHLAAWADSLGAGWWWPTWPPGTARRGTIRSGWRRRTPRSWESRPSSGHAVRAVRGIMSRNGHDRTGEGGAGDHQGHQALLPQVRGRRHAAVRGGLHIVSGRIVIEAELDTGAAARRLRTDISEVFGHDSDLVVVNACRIRRCTRYVCGCQGRRGSRPADRMIDSRVARPVGCRPRW
jgi:hypothetical protein